MNDGPLLHRLERYLDAVPRSAARVEAFASLTMFAHSGPSWPYYARPTLGWPGDIRPGDLEAVRLRQRQLGEPEALEWVDETTPSLRPLAEEAGLSVEALPLMVLTRPITALAPADVGIRVLSADDPDLALAYAVADVGFSASGTAAGPAGAAERDAAAGRMTPEREEFVRDRMRRGRLVTAVAEDDHIGLVSVGSHQPVEDVTEVVGVATLPRTRRRGLGAAITAHLVADAAERGVDTVFLSAGSAEIARMYARVGFERVGTSCVGEPAR